MAILVMVAGMLASCSDKKKKNLENVPDEVKPVAEAIISDSPAEFAHVVSYPVTRPYPLRDVEDSSQMVKYYPTLMDNNIRKAVEEAPDSAWQQEGWRGWTLGNGSYFWIDAGKIYEINYISDREHSMLDSLQKVEISSLEPSMQIGWQPVMCVTDSATGAIFRIDSQDDTNPPIYRLAGYSAGSDLSGTPAIVLYGYLELEGSMGNRFYTFSDEDGTTAMYAPDLCADDESPEIEIDRKGVSKRYKAKPGYWLDHVKMPGHERERKAGPANGSVIPDSTILNINDTIKRVSEDSGRPDSVQTSKPKKMPRRKSDVVRISSGLKRDSTTRE